jgi:hypothetical protein
MDTRAAPPAAGLHLGRARMMTLGFHRVGQESTELLAPALGRELVLYPP